MNYTIQIEVDEDGYPRWQHDERAEARLNAAQQETVRFIRQRYVSSQDSWRGLQGIRALFHRPEQQESVVH